MVRTKLSSNDTVNNFYLIWDCLGIKRKKVGNTSDIQTISLQLKGSKKQSGFVSQEYCVIYEGIKEHRFGMWLTKAEMKMASNGNRQFCRRTISPQKQRELVKRYLEA